MQMFDAPRNLCSALAAASPSRTTPDGDSDPLPAGS